MPELFTPKALGCLVTGDDIPRVFTSICVYGAEIGYGACCASIALSIPIIFTRYSLSPVSLGSLFLCAGVGYIIGLVISTRTIEHLSLPISKTGIVCLSVLASAIFVLCSAFAANVYVLNVLVLAQFIGFGCVEYFGTIVLLEMWGQRIQPWLQAKHALRAVGGVIPSTFHSSGSIRSMCIASAVVCVLALMGVLCDWGYLAVVRYKTSRSSTIIAESTSLLGQSSSRSRERIKIPSICEEDYMAAEYVLLESTLDQATSVQLGNKLTELVTHVLDATEYCNVTQKQRNDPFYEPSIVKTLCYATPAVVASMQRSLSSRPVALIPLTAVVMLACLCCVCVAVGESYTAWTLYFLIQRDQVEDEHHCVILRVYYIASTLACCLSAPLTVRVSASALLRGLLATTLLTIILGFTLNKSLISVLCVTALLGWSIGPMIPLLIAVVNDYGYSMDALAVRAVLMGAGIGLGFAPFVIGFIVTYLGHNSIPLAYAVLVASLIVSYAGFHFYLLRQKSVSAQPFHIDNSGRFNSYQRAQSILFDNRRGHTTRTAWRML